MYEQNPYEKTEAPTDVYKNIRFGMGIFLSSLGVILAIVIFVFIYKLIKDPTQIGVFRTLIPDEPNVRNLEMNDEVLKIPMGIYYFLSYFVMAILLFICSGIGTGFIKLGVSLIYPRVDKLEAKLNSQTWKLNNKITSLKARIPRFAEVKPPKTGKSDAPGKGYSYTVTYDAEE